MENDSELDLVVFEDDDGNELTMEVLDYLAYEGKEYALLAEYNEDLDETSVRDAFVMEIRPLPDDPENEEFIPITDENLAQTLIEIFQTTDFEEYDDFEDEE